MLIDSLARVEENNTEVWKCISRIDKSLAILETKLSNGIPVNNKMTRKTAVATGGISTAIATMVLVIYEFIKMLGKNN